MKVIIEAVQTTNQWRFTAAPELRIYALQQFYTDNGELVLRGTVGSNEPHLPIACTLDGDILQIPSIEIDSTPFDPPAYYTAIFVVGGRKVPFMSNFAVPAEPSGTRWDALTDYQRIGRMRYVNPPLAQLQQIVSGMIANALTFLRFGSETQAGMTALSVDPLDPAFPIALAANDPRVQMLSSPSAIVTEAYAVVAGDNHTTLALGGGIHYAVTFGAVAGFDDDFSVTLLNTDAVRAKTINVDGLASFFLYPGQIAYVRNVSGAWRSDRTARWVAPAALTVYVDAANGNDNNDGLASGSGNALATLQAAINKFKADIDLGGPRATPPVVQLALDQIYSGGANPVLMVSGPFVGQQPATYTFPSANEVPILIRGDVANPARAVLTSSASIGTVLAVWGGVIGIEGVKITNTGAGSDVEIGGAAGVQVGSGVILGACGRAKIKSEHGSISEDFGTVFLEGNCASVLEASNHSSLYFLGTFSVLSSFTCTQFTLATECSEITLQPGIVFALNGNVVTGRRFTIKGSSSINTGTFNPTLIPGTVAGSVLGSSTYSNMSWNTANAYSNTAISVPDALVTPLNTLTYNTTDFDTNDLATNRNIGRLEAKEDGLYEAEFKGQWAAGGGTYRFLGILRSDGVFVAAESRPPIAGAAMSMAVRGRFIMAAGQHVVVQAGQDSGGALNLNRLSAISPEFSLRMVSP